MQAIVITKPGDVDVLQLVERPRPEPQRGEVRVRVRATAVNRADLLQRMGAYPAPPDSPPDIPGLELAGEVEAIGDGVQRLAVGDRVFGLVGGGAYAEAVVSHERALAKMPDGLSFEEAAAIPEAFVTAHDAMVTQANLRSGEAVLIHGVGSGVGTAASQLSRALGAYVIGTARTADKLEKAKELGVDHGIVVGDGGKFAGAVHNATQMAGAAVILELIGGAYLAEDVHAVAIGGRIVLVGLLAGVRADLDLRMLLHKRASITGTTLRARPLEGKIAAMRAFEAQVVPLFARGKLRAVVDRTFPLSDAAGAHRYMASNAGFGKVVLSV